MENIVETKKCRFCSSSFEITDRDLEFYDKISPVFSGKKYNIPTPTLCPDCINQQKLSFRNERKFYKDKCCISGKNIISIFSPDKGYKVVDHMIKKEINNLEFGIDYDFKKGVSENFKILYKNTYKYNLINGLNQENSEYNNYIDECKNTYMCIGGSLQINTLYSFESRNIKDSLDIHVCSDIENGYECINCSNLYGCFFTYNSDNSNNLIFCDNCNNCSYCFICTNLTGKKYYIKNKQYTKEEYFQKIQKIDLGSYKNLLKFKDDFLVFLKTIVRIYGYNFNSELSVGNYISNSKNCYYCFDCISVNNAKYSYEIGRTNNICYSYRVYDGEGLIYNSSDLINCYKCLFCQNMSNCDNIFYSLNMLSCKDCFLCNGLHNKQYCILNKQYTKEQYEELVPKIIEHMIKTGEWGEFFPSSMSPFGYNETVAQEYYPISSPPAREGLGEGVRFNWSTYEPPFPKVEKIIPASKLSDNIADIPDDILNWAIECEVTKKPFRIIAQELEFYRKHNLPIPRRHPDQRHLDRMALRNPRKLFDRKCDKCGKDIKTTYSPDRKEIVYCEECYNREVY